MWGLKPGPLWFRSISPWFCMHLSVSQNLVQKCVQLRWSNLHFICISAVHITSFYVSFLSRVKMNSVNWPAPNIWVFIAQLEEHCSANAEAMGSNPVEALKFFSGLNLQLPKLQLQLQWSNLHFKSFVNRKLVSKD